MSEENTVETIKVKLNGSKKNPKKEVVDGTVLKKNSKTTWVRLPSGDIINKKNRYLNHVK